MNELANKHLIPAIKEGLISEDILSDKILFSIAIEGLTYSYSSQVKNSWLMFLDKLLKSNETSKDDFLVFLNTLKSFGIFGAWLNVDTKNNPHEHLTLGYFKNSLLDI